jgi:hypothetical protein
MLRSFATRLAAALVVCLMILAGRAEAGAAEPSPPPPPVRSMVVFGDSQAQGVAAGLRRLYARDRLYHIIDKTVPGTALSQKLQFDWVGTIEQWLGEDHADIAVVMFGGNDRLAARPEAGAKAIAYRTEAWKQLYTQRLNGVLGLLAAAKMPVVWLGQPVAREADYSTDMAWLNGLFEATVPASGADFLPLWTVIADETGNYAAYGKGLDGETKRMRLDDGIHFTPAGYDIIAVKVKDRIDALVAKAAGSTTADGPQTAPPAPTPAAERPAPGLPARSIADRAAHS